MTVKTKRNAAFTLIELLTVIAIIGILAGILIPTVGIVRKQASIATTKAQFSSYIGALNEFKAQYGFYPTFDSTPDANGQISFALGTEGGGQGVSEDFIETLSARDIDGNPTAGWKDTNRRRIQFYNFTEDNFYANPDPIPTQIADSFNNTNIEVYIDTRGRGFLDIEGEVVRTSIAIRSVADTQEDLPGIKSWE